MRRSGSASGLSSYLHSTGSFITSLRFHQRLNHVHPEGIPWNAILSTSAVQRELRNDSHTTCPTVGYLWKVSSDRSVAALWFDHTDRNGRLLFGSYST